MYIVVPNDNNQRWPAALPLVSSVSVLTIATQRAQSARSTIAGADEEAVEPPPIVSPPSIPAGFIVETRAPSAVVSENFYSTMRHPQAPHTKDAEIPPTEATSPQSAKLRGLPDLPRWAVGILAGLLTCGLIMAVVLYFVNYPSHWDWLARLGIRRRTRYEYRQLDDSDEDDSDGAGRPKLKRRLASDEGGAGYSSGAGLSGSAKRRNKNLSVDTSAHYTGLGIALPGKYTAPEELLSQTRRSFDEEKLSYRPAPPLSPARFAWEAVTAPLPSISTFGHTGLAPRSARDGGKGYKHPELESGMYDPYSGAAVEETSDPPSPAAKVEFGHGNIFERIGFGIEHAAEKFARVLNDHIKDDPEENLLLPVRDHEREQVGSPMVHVR